MEPFLAQSRPSFFRRFKTLTSFLVLLLIVAMTVIGSILVVGYSPKNFVPGTVVTIAPRMSTQTAGDLLEDLHVIKSSSMFQFIVQTIFADRPVIAGDFSFEKPLDVIQVARMVTGGQFGSAQVKVMIPEGSSVSIIAALIKKSIPNFDDVSFIKRATPHEGYLFPATYLLFKTVTPDQVITMMTQQFEKRTISFESEIASSKKTMADIITMASLLEKEAYNATEAAIISGILWKRIEQGMPIQVDAPFLFILGKTSADLTRKDLEKDHPYNTYTRKGLPAGPIGNPGSAMIQAALRPKTSPYLFYLHDSKGTIYYAKTYTEHLANKKKYLNN